MGKRKTRSTSFVDPDNADEYSSALTEARTVSTRHKRGNDKAGSELQSNANQDSSNQIADEANDEITYLIGKRLRSQDRNSENVHIAHQQALPEQQQQQQQQQRLEDDENSRHSTSPLQEPWSSPYSHSPEYGNNSAGDIHSSQQTIEFWTSGSPTRVSGSRVAADVNFNEVGNAETCRVDKSLVCKGFWEVVGKAGRICLPRRSGKTYNLTQLLLFYSISPEKEYLHLVPDSALSISGGTSIEDVQSMDVETKCRRKREYLFEGSLLQTMHPQFYREHFMKYPVLHISFSECRGATLDIFLISICSAITLATGKWLSRCRNRPGEMPIDVQITMDTLQKYLGQFAESRVLISSGQVNYPSLALALINGLSYLISELFGYYILLIDEYDIPFITIKLASWSMEEKQIAQLLVRSLFQRMLKDNKSLLRGLLVGVFHVPLTEMGSGANNIKDIRMVPCDLGDIRSGIRLASTQHRLDGLDALTDSFWFNAEEIEQMLENSSQVLPIISEHKDIILDTIREWYNGYYIGRFSGKYNPWSVGAFIEKLYDILNRTFVDNDDIEQTIKGSGRSYWVETGTTGPIEKQIDQHRGPFTLLAKRLLDDYEAAKTNNQLQVPPSVQLDSAQLDMTEADDEQFIESKILTMCLYAGYLTRHLRTTVRIPNREVHQVWVRLYARAMFGVEPERVCLNYEQGKLLRELWHGNTDYLRTLSILPHSCLRTRKSFREKKYANHFAGALAIMNWRGALTHPSHATVDMAHAVITRENETGVGECDLMMRLYSTTNKPAQFGVIIEFKYIPEAVRDNSNARKVLSIEALSQITTKRYPSCLNGCLERLDIGIAIGDEVVEITTQLHKRYSGRGAWNPVGSLFAGTNS